MGTRRAIVERHLSDAELKTEIKKADDPKVVRRLCFLNNLYAGDTILEAATRVGASRSIGIQWLQRWKKLNQKLGNRLFDTLDELRDTALTALDNIDPSVVSSQSMSSSWVGVNDPPRTAHGDRGNAVY